MLALGARGRNRESRALGVPTYALPRGYSGASLGHWPVARRGAISSEICICRMERAGLVQGACGRNREGPGVPTYALPRGPARRPSGRDLVGDL